jgi:uncharacterized protein (DUF2267 family)
MTAIHEFENALRSTEKWIDDLQRRLDWRDREKVYSAFVATLHALRDSLPSHEAVFLADRLTVFLRGRFFEGWHLQKYSSFKSRDAFLERIREGVHHDPGIDAERVAREVMALLADRLPSAEIEDVKAVTPKALRALWPA